MPPKKEGIYDEYFAYQREYEEKFGNDTVVLMQVGSFYELYGYNISETSSIGKIYEISKMLRMKIAVRENTVKSPSMVGFPCITIDRQLETIIENNYTVVIVDQEKNGDKITRKIREVVSPTMAMDAPDSKITLTNQFVCVFIETQRIRYPVRNSKECEEVAIAAGLSCIDVSTGKNTVCETFSIASDKILAIQETYRFLVAHSPREVLIEVAFLDKQYHEIYKSFLHSQLELEKYPIVHIKFDTIPVNFRKLEYQQQFFEKVFRKTTPPEKDGKKTIVKNNDIIDDIGLGEQSYGCISYMILLQYCYEHNANLVDNINKPNVTWMMLADHLQLAHNAIDQLHLLPLPPALAGNKTLAHDSIFSVVNKTTTSVGKKYLRSMLLNPLTDVETLNFFYNLIEDCVNNKSLLRHVQHQFKTLSDIERLQRKLTIQSIRPLELSNLLTSYQTINEVQSSIVDSGASNLKQLFFEGEAYSNFNLALKKFYTTVIIDEMANADYLNGRINCVNSFLREGVNPNIDRCQKDISSNMIKINKIIDHLNDFFKTTRGQNIILYRSSKHNDLAMTEEEEEDSPPSKGKAKTSPTPKIEIPMLLISEAKAKKLKNMNYDTGLCGTLKFESYKEKKSKIQSVIIEKLLQEVEIARVSMLDYLTVAYRALIKELYDLATFNSDLNGFVAVLDYTCSNATVALENKYYRPRVVSGTGPSFLEYRKFRHPLIEKLIQTDYVPNDISLGVAEPTKKIVASKGALLLGLNSSGKCFDPQTLVIMFDGSLKEVQHIQSGEKLLGDDSRPRTVLTTTSGRGLMYKITPQGAKEFIVNGPHILCLKSLGKKNFIHYEAKKTFRVNWIDPSGNLQFQYFPHTEDNILAVLSEVKDFISMLETDVDRIIEISVTDYLAQPKIWRSNYILYRVGVEYEEKLVPYSSYTLGYWLGSLDSVDPSTLFLNTRFLEDLMAEKHIPALFLYNSTHIRAELLRGFMTARRALITSRFKLPPSRLREDLVTLIRSLSLSMKIIKDEIIIYSGHEDDSFEDVVLSFTVTEMGMGDYVGFQTDGNQRFLLSDFIVTHNSSLTRAIGLGIIMAQAGMFVPGLLTFKPYTKILTRLTGNDDMLHGRSSFVVEMLELRTILRSADDNSLVLADEACRGTETLSGSAIAITMIQTLIERQATFIMSTHLHHLPQVEPIKTLSKEDLRICHLTTLYDSSNSSLIFERKLKDGPGKSTYGIEVAKYLNLDYEFILQAEKTRKLLASEPQMLLNPKVSRYNSKVYLDSCLFCQRKDALETHHVEEQRLADEEGFIDDKHKDRKSNLIAVCEDCHQEIHNQGKKVVVNTRGLHDGKLVYELVDNT